MNIEKLKELDRLTEQRIADKRLVSAAYAVAYKNEIVFKNAIGYADIENRIPLRSDTIVRLASMTKPITGVATMIMYERGAFSLDDPVSKFIPSFKHMNVAIVDEHGKITGQYPAKNEIQIRDLLNQASGLGEGEAGNRAWKDYHIKQGDTLAGMVPKFGDQLLDFEPRKQAIYSWTQAFDTAAYIVELTSGMDFEQFVLDNILHPLGCYDTVYKPSKEQRARLMKMYDARDGKITEIDMGDTIFGDVPLSYYAAGAGMVGTLDDYMKFAAMLYNKGEYNGARILKPETVGLMATPSLPFFNPGTDVETWGLSMRVINKKTEHQLLSPGCFGWSGAYGTHFFIDPSNEIYAVYIKNLLDGGGAGADTAREFERVIVEAL
ncbi:MAG: beta-lactamase family protein [Clostridia bacterium]|nr:beta-lactamase family protein [Clostridia bacterium]